MNKETIIEHLKSSKVRKEVELHQNIENFLSSHPQEYVNFLAISLEKGKIQDINFLLGLTEYSFINASKTTPFHYLSKNSLLEKEQYEAIITKIMERKEYQGIILEDALAQSSVYGSSAFTHAIRAGNLYFLSLINDLKIDISSSHPDKIYETFSDLKNNTFIHKFEGTNAYLVREKALKLLDKMKLPKFQENYNKTNQIFEYHLLKDKKGLLGFKFYCNLLKNSGAFGRISNEIFNHMYLAYSNEMHNPHKNNYLTNLLLAFKKEETLSLSVGTLMALSTAHTDYNNLLQHPKIQHCIAKDPQFFNDFCLTLSKLYAGHKKDPVFLDAMQQTFEECKKHNNLVVDDSLLDTIEHHQDRGNYITHLFLLSNNYPLIFKDNDNSYNFTDNIMQFESDFFIKDKDIKSNFAYIFPVEIDKEMSKPDFLKIISNIHNIPTGTIARTAINLGSVNSTYKASNNFVEDKKLFDLTFENSSFFKALSDNDPIVIKKEIESYFKASVNYSSDSSFERYSGDPEDYSFHSCFGKHLHFMKDILENYNDITKESIKTFFSTALDTYTSPQNNYCFENRELYPLILSEIEKMVLTVDLSFEQQSIKPAKKRL